MHVEKQMQIIELITSVGVLTIIKMKNESEEYCVKFYDTFIVYHKDLGQALLKLLELLYNDNIWFNFEQSEFIKNLLES